MQMDYFRRPILSGKALARLNAGHLRGSVRRLDPDGTSAVPYFAGVSATQTLILSVDGTPVTVALTGTPPTYQSILNDINTALGITGKATDDDGCIGIQTFSPGGFVQVTGGTAATALGFDLTAQRFRSAGGDMLGAPERRFGNPFGAAFPTRGEDLTVDSMNRALARLSSNLDVLYAEHVRQDARMVKIAAGSTTVSSPATGTSIITLPAATRVFTGANLLPSTPTPEALAPFIQLIDPTTNLPPASCRVIDVVRGTVSGSPPYADAGSYAGFGSVIDVDLIKFSGTIATIVNGRVISVSGAVFTTNGTKVGDWVKITGATNTAPWSNNGYRWVVEEIIDNTHLALRPMSQSEAAQAALSGNTEEQPIVELNTELSGGEVFGTIEVHTGTFTDGVKLVVQPQMPEGATYDVYVTQPISLREANSGTGAQFPVAANVISQLNPMPNGVISGFGITAFLGGGFGDSSFTTADGFIRLHGKILRIPGKTYNASDFGSDGTYQVYFDELDSRVKFAATLPSTSRTSYDPTGADTHAVVHPLYQVNVFGTATRFSTVLTIRSARFATPSVERITVGNGGDFDDLSTAAIYINALSAAHSETSNSSSAGFPHFEVVLLNTQSVAEEASLTCPSLTIRGANPLVELDFSTAPALLLTNCYFFKLQDCRLSTQTLVPCIQIGNHTVAGDGIEMYLSRVSHVSGADSSCLVVGTSSSSRLKKLVIEDCNFTLSNSITQIDKAGSFQDIEISRSHIVYDGDGSSTVMFQPFLGIGHAWAGSYISLVDNFFDGWWTDSLTGSVVAEADAGGARFHAHLNVWSFGSFPTNSTAALWNVAASSVIDFKRNIFTSVIPRAIHHRGDGSEVCGNVMLLAPHGTAADTEAVVASVINFNFITASVPSSNSLGAVLCPRATALGNRLSGQARIGIQAASSVGGAQDDVVIDGNFVSLTTGAITAIKCHGILSLGNRVRVVNNIVSMSTIGGYALSAAAICVDNATANLIHGNVVTHSGCFGFLARNSSANGELADNRFINTVDTGVSGATAISLRNRWFLAGNQVFGTALSGYVGLRGSAAAELYVDDNYFDMPIGVAFSSSFTTALRVTNSAFTGTADFSQVTDAKIVDNRFDGLLSSQTRGTVSSNQCNGGATIGARTTSSDILVVDDNEFLTGAVSVTETNGKVRFVGNKFLTATTFSKTGGGTGFVSVVDNEIDSSSLSTSGFAIDQLNDNRIDGAGTVILTNAEVLGNVFTGGGTLALTTCQFIANKILNYETDFTGCLLDGNIWDAANAQFIELDGPTQSSNNTFQNSGAGIVITGLFASTDDVINSAATFSGNVVMSGTTFTVDVNLTGTNAPNVLGDVTTTGDIKIGGQGATITGCSAVNLSTATWSANQIVVVVGGHYTGNVSLATSGGVRSGSVLDMTGVECDGIFALSGPSSCRIFGGAATGVSGSTFATMNDLSITGTRCGGVSVSSITQVYLVGAQSVTLGFVLATIASLRMNACAGVSISATGITGSFSIENSVDTATISVTYVNGAVTGVIEGNHFLVPQRGQTGILVKGTANSALIEKLTISDNTILVDNVNGSGSIAGFGIQVGDPVLSVANSHKVRHIVLDDNNIVINPFPNTVSLGIGSDAVGQAFQLNIKAYGGIIGGNHANVPRPIVFGGADLRYQYILGPVFDTDSAGVVCSGNSFTATVWATGSPPTIGAHTFCTDGYDDGTGSSIGASGTDDIYGGGFRKLLNASGHRANVPITLSP